MASEPVPYSPYFRNNDGFSLIELAIVLAILGLILGGIVGGRSLVRQSEIRELSNSLTTYSSAVDLFQGTYRSLPGDMRDATNLWQAQDPSPATCVVTPSTTMATCDGNGDQMISGYEIYRAWQHLANAGLISGKYSGVSGSGGTLHSVPATNTPKTKVGSAGYDFLYIAPVATDSNPTYFQNNYGNMLILGKANATDIAMTGLLKPEEAWNIDKKIDDAKPNSGTIVTLKDGAWSNNCTNSSAYAVDRTTGACTLLLNLAGASQTASGSTP